MSAYQRMNDQIGVSTKVISDVVYELRLKQDALAELHQIEFSKDLGHLAITLNKQINLLRKISGDVIQEYFHQSQQSSANILNACLAGIELSQTDKN